MNQQGNILAHYKPVDIYTGSSNKVTDIDFGDRKLWTNGVFTFDIIQVENDD